MAQNAGIKGKTRIVERFVNINKADDSFDLKFWKRAGNLAIFSAAWGIIKDYYKIKGLDESKLRLRKDVERIIRRKPQMQVEKGEK